MKVIRQNIHAIIGFALLGSFLTAGAVLYFDVDLKPQARSSAAAEAEASCPMHSGGTKGQPGEGHNCGMAHPGGGEGGEGCAAHADASTGCCSSKKAEAVKLPPGHPPIGGMMVEAERK